jgi:hypothetical protein
VRLMGHHAVCFSVRLCLCLPVCLCTNVHLSLSLNQLTGLHENCDQRCATGNQYNS